MTTPMTKPGAHHHTLLELARNAAGNRHVYGGEEAELAYAWAVGDVSGEQVARAIRKGDGAASSGALYCFLAHALREWVRRNVHPKTRSVK